MSIKRILFTGARSPAVLASARTMARCGYTVFAADSTDANLCLFSNKVSKFFKLLPTKDKKYKETLIGIVKREKIDLVIPSCEEIFFISAFLDELGQYCKVFCDEQRKLLALHDKWTFYRYLTSKGLKTPKTNLSSAMPRQMDKKYIIKPRFSRFASKVICASEIDNKRHNDSYIVQDFVKGQQYCSYALVENGKIISRSTYITLLNAGRGAGILLKYIEDKEITGIEAFIAKDFNFTGQLAFDFIKDENGDIFIIECNPRMTSGLVFIEDAFLPVVSGGCNKCRAGGYLASLLLAVLIYMPLQLLRTLRCAREICFAKDIVFDRTDLMPFFMQIPISLYWLIKSIFYSGPTAASTIDIEFNMENR